MRKDWDEYYIDLAQSLATRGTCNRAQVGCVLVKDNLQLAEGYNGSVSGALHCDDIGHLMVNNHCVRTIHAEVNALLNAMKKGVSVVGAKAYVTHQPCFECTKLLNQAGIKEVIFLKPYGKIENLHEVCEGMTILPFVGKGQ